MSDFSVRRMGVGALLLAGAVVATGCEDKRVKQLDTGISRDSALSVISKGAPAAKQDSFPNVYWRDRYLIAGKNYEVLYFNASDVKRGKDSVSWKKTTPIVFVNGKLIGRGWSYWDSVSKANQIPLKPR